MVRIKLTTRPIKYTRPNSKSRFKSIARANFEKVKLCCPIFIYDLTKIHKQHHIILRDDHDDVIVDAGWAYLDSKGIMWLPRTTLNSEGTLTGSPSVFQDDIKIEESRLTRINNELCMKQHPSSTYVTLATIDEVRYVKEIFVE